MSADTRPIEPARFAAALKDLSVGMLHLKVLEIRNSIAHLQYSNDQLRPFADGSATALDATTTTTTTTTTSSSSPAPPNAAATTAGHIPDQDCVDAIRENEQVMERMVERIALVRLEVEERGLSWTEFQSNKDEEGLGRKDAEATEDAHPSGGGGGGNGINPAAPAAATAVNGEAPHSAWTDGTFQTGTIRGGQVRLDSQQPGRAAPTTTTGANGEGAPTGGSLSDEQLRRALEERMRDLGRGDDDDDDDDGGMHL
ncbi:hypothetical protein JDV02_001361 [Purpureocillium takamizusanense]|uniref:Secondary alcohol dehydrogenase n=1 Tax=Purpureocillium takamizusanense TaxID=2060973 RepID=A0A9Q8V6I6_9HYPO|nr:uncharacterized protein JDV02_001361 [Purpureocillium takamizusanense]UNI14763.1 hypothetical protein JDV02_001361 [Purpureocillium takamizusanense]